MERVFEILRRVNRPGTEAVINYMKESDYATARCYGHHKYSGGLIDHSLEVYDIMKSCTQNVSDDTLAICALFHDLGKSKKPGLRFYGDHPLRSLQILEMCGYQLTDDEVFAIGKHHSRNPLHWLGHPMRQCLSIADMLSTKAWKEAHPEQCRRRRRRR